MTSRENSGWRYSGINIFGHAELVTHRRKRLLVNLKRDMASIRKVDECGHKITGILPGVIRRNDCSEGKRPMGLRGRLSNMCIDVVYFQ
jgi:hypothetical protein